MAIHLDNHLKPRDVWGWVLATMHQRDPDANLTLDHLEFASIDPARIACAADILRILDCETWMRSDLSFQLDSCVRDFTYFANGPLQFPGNGHIALELVALTFQYKARESFTSITSHVIANTNTNTNFSAVPSSVLAQLDTLGILRTYILN